MSKTVTLMEEYYKWLCGLIDVEQRNKTYWQLTDALYNKEFSWSVPNDDNRAFEGKNLREKFCEEYDIDYLFDDFPGEVSMFELIIGLAYRCESIMADEPSGRPMCDWFWELMGNVGLDKFDDKHFDRLYDLMAFDEIIDRIIERHYERNGKGGLFPVKRDKKDQRHVELWYQMNTYLIENYYSDEEGIV